MWKSFNWYFLALFFVALFSATHSYTSMVVHLLYYSLAAFIQTTSHQFFFLLFFFFFFSTFGEAPRFLGIDLKCRRDKSWIAHNKKRDKKEEEEWNSYTNSRSSSCTNQPTNERNATQNTNCLTLLINNDHWTSGARVCICCTQLNGRAKECAN